MKPKYITPYADEWFSGPPPSLGWWPASTLCDPNVIRYYDGKRWSTSMLSEMRANRADDYAACKDYSGNVKWAKRWWEKAK
jgi:hypothetical protein